MEAHQFIGQQEMGIQKLSKFWSPWQPTQMLQIMMELLQFIGQRIWGIQKLSKYWPLWQTILMLQIIMKVLLVNIEKKYNWTIDKANNQEMIQKF